MIWRKLFKNVSPPLELCCACACAPQRRRRSQTLATLCAFDSVCYRDVSNEYINAFPLLIVKLCRVVSARTFTPSESWHELEAQAGISDKRKLVTPDSLQCMWSSAKVETYGADLSRYLSRAYSMCLRKSSYDCNPLAL